jgi:hypothetical protein
MVHSAAVLKLGVDVVEVTVMGVLDESGVFDATDIEGICWYYLTYGYVVVRGLYSAEAFDRMEAECVDAQGRVVAGDLPERYGSTQCSLSFRTWWVVWSRSGGIGCGGHEDRAFGVAHGC